MAKVDLAMDLRNLVLGTSAAVEVGAFNLGRYPHIDECETLSDCEVDLVFERPKDTQVDSE